MGCSRTTPRPRRPRRPPEPRHLRPGVTFSPAACVTFSAAIDTRGRGPLLRGYAEGGGQSLHPDGAELLQSLRVGAALHPEDAGDGGPDPEQPCAALLRGARREGRDGAERQRTRGLRARGPPPVRACSCSSRRSSTARPRWARRSRTGSSSASTAHSWTNTCG